MTKTKRIYSLKKDNPNSNHKFHKFALTPVHELPQVVDLRKYCPLVYDQGDLNSCTANAIAAALEFDQIKQKEATHFTPSRLFIYYNERSIENDVNDDQGACIFDGINSVATTGYCKESDWPYDITKVKIKPSKKSYDIAKNHKSVEYKKVEQTLPQLKQCLYEGYPFILGLTIYESFESDEVTSNGLIPMPNLKNEKCLGGHAVLFVGYDDNKQCFIGRNSWGTNWGINGYFYIPYKYVTDPNLATDFWTIRHVKDISPTIKSKNHTSIHKNK